MSDQLGNLASTLSIYGEYDKVLNVVENRLNQMQTNILARVEEVFVDTGRVSITPLVDLIDLSGNSERHVIVFDIPYLTLQGGDRGVICPPVVGDIGVCSVVSRDITNVKENKSESPPPTRRTYDFSDSIYISTVLMDKPLDRIEFEEDGSITADSRQTLTLTGSVTVLVNSDGPLEITCDTVTITATETTIDGAVSITGDVSVTGNITATGDITSGAISLGTHRHGGVTVGAAFTTGSVP